MNLKRDLIANPVEEIAIVGRGATLQRAEEDAAGEIRVVTLATGRYRRGVLEQVPMLCVSDSAGDCTIEDMTDESGSFTIKVNQLMIGPASASGDSGAGVVTQESFTDMNSMKSATATAVAGQSPAGWLITMAGWSR